jgi:hypothetical protein
MGFEYGNPLNFRCACHGRSPAQNRSISRNARSDTLDPCLKSIWSSNVQIRLPSFPFGCYTNPGFRILSAYTTSAGDTIWILTEADRSATTLLLPEEY